jgi:hypothetical protein
MVDEYDRLKDDLAPFWALSGKELQRCILQVSLMCSSDFSHRLPIERSENCLLLIWLDSETAALPLRTFIVSQ